jgi:hypothetical protein
MADAALVHRGMNQTSMAFMLVNATTTPNSLSQTKQFALFEKGDKWNYFYEYCKVPLAEINQLLDRKVLNLATKDRPANQSCEVQGLGSGDMSFLHSINGLAGCGGWFKCLYCECPADQLNVVGAGPFRKRTLHRMKLYGHTTTGRCPGCYKVLTEADLAAPGDKPPPFPKNQLYRQGEKKWSHARIHRGASYGCYPLINLEPWQWSPCLLHMLLRIIGALFEKTILKFVDVRPTTDGDDSGSMANLLFDLLWECLVPIKPITKPSKNKALYYSSIRKHSFHGRDAAVLLVIFPRMLDLVFPVSMRDPSNKEMYDEETFKKHALFTALWTTWAEVWAVIQAGAKDEPPCASATDCTSNPVPVFVASKLLSASDVAKFSQTCKSSRDVCKKELKARHVELTGTKFMGLWREAFPNSSHLYTHVLVEHLPDFIRNLPVDPWLLMTQGLEHCHKWRKRVHNHATNHKKPTDQKTSAGKTVRARTAQALAHCVALDALKHCSTNPSLEQQDFEKLKIALLKRALAKFKRLSVLAEFPEPTSSPV